MILKPGFKAPEFSLYSTEKKEVSLSDYRGKNVLILFFPLAFTSVCTEELCSVRDQISKYNDLHTDILAISVDSIFCLAKFKEAQGLNFTLLSDFNKEVSRAYDALYETFVFEMKEVSKRAAFVVDKIGVIRYAEVLDDARNIPNFSNILETLSDLK